MREGGRNCLKNLKRGWNRKEGRRNKDFEKGGGGQAGARGGGLKKRGTGTPLQTMYVYAYLSLADQLALIIYLIIFVRHY